jgi:TonB family protein
VLLETHWVEIQPQPTRIALDIRRHLTKPRPPKLPDRLRRFIQQRAIQIQACYERRLKHNPTLHGKLTLRINVDEDGRVSQVSQLVDTLEDPKVGRCAQHVIERWHFPPGRAAQVVYPFIFRAR